MKKIILASIFAAGLAVSFPAGAQADSNVKDYMDRHQIGDPDYHYGWYPHFYRGRLTCGEAKQRVRRNGYRNIVTIECWGSTYTFEATRKGRDVTVLVNSRTGALRRR